MNQWEVRWRTPTQAVVTLDDIQSLPLQKRPAVVLPLLTNIKTATAEIDALAKTFPEIILSIDGAVPNDPYMSQLLLYARRGYAIRDDEGTHFVRFGVRNEGNWTPEQACQLLTRINLTVGNNGIIEQFFPSDFAARLVARRLQNDPWLDAAKNYRTNKGLRIYTPITAHTRAIEAMISLSDGIVLEPGMRPEPDVNAVWRGTVTRTSYGGER